MKRGRGGWVGIFVFGWVLVGWAAEPTDAARRVLERVIGAEMTARIALEPIPSLEGHDVYEYSATNGVLTVRGSSTPAVCRGVYEYLRANQLGTVGWAGPRLNLPEVWPDAALTAAESPFKIRHCYNVVTAGYTFPYWTWERWEQELDWLVMHGYNMMMAPVANEAILSRVWAEIGLTRSEIAEYFTGPAHLPWNRMGNIRQVGGTMTDAWHADQIQLQKRILARAREVGIEPVVQCFAGFVPPAIQRLHPEIRLNNTLWNGGFPASQRPVSIMPDEPFFKEIMVRFVRNWKREFGAARYFLVDSFNEMRLPEGDPEELLATYGGKTYEALTAGAPDAIWVLQGWMFNYQRDIWNKKTVRSLMQAVPQDRLLVLDFANDYNPNWDDFSAFHGKPWIMGYVPNMGGKTAYTGKMDFYAAQAAKTLASSERGNLVGFTISAEGFDNNEVLFELMSDSAWSSEALDLAAWLPAYVQNRYGTADPSLVEAWRMLRASVYSSFSDHPTFGWQRLSLRRGSVYRGDGFIQAVSQFLSEAERFGDRANYRDDAIEMAALALGLRAEDWFVLADAAFARGDRAGCQAHADRALALLLQADRLLESHAFHRLDRWLAMAHAHQGTAAERREYQRNARQIVTVWGPPVNDYSCRVWAGLLRDFYVPRMRAQIQAMVEERTFDRRAWEAAWVETGKTSSVEPFADPAVAARDLFEAAYAEVLADMPSMDDLIARWYPNQMSATWTTLEWDFPAHRLDELKAIVFRYSAGAHRLEIDRVAIVADGQEVAVKQHRGSTGHVHENNRYELTIPAGTKANNSCTLRARVRSGGGTDSSGTILMIPHLKK